jgi:hypothetical protein
MPEVPCPGKDHGNTVPVTGLNGKAVVYRAARLYDGPDARGGRDLRYIGNKLISML